MGRQDQIRVAIEGLPGDAFARFATALLKNELYPDLNPTSDSHDLGEDAHTEASTAHLSGGERVAVLISKTATLAKVKSDCRRCRETGRSPSFVVFATAGNPRTDTRDAWRRAIADEFGWSLEVRTLDWFVMVAAEARYDRLVEELLRVPPPHGDAAEDVDAAFARHTRRALRHAQLVIPGIRDPIPREELGRVEDQLRQGKGVVLSGEPGSGKSAIGIMLARRAQDSGKAVLLLDARAVVHITSEADVQTYLSLNGPLATAAERVGRVKKGCRLIIDQWDSCIGRQSATVLVDVVRDCGDADGVEVVVISRNTEAHEADVLTDLVDAGFVELTSFALDRETVLWALRELGIADPSTEVIALGRNLLNLSLIGAIKQRQPEYNFSTVMGEVELWDEYRRILIKHEAVGSGTDGAERIAAEAARLARDGLNSPDRAVVLGHPLSREERRLLSWEILLRNRGRSVRFRHDQLQDYLYAQDAAARAAMPSTVLDEIDAYRTRGVCRWIDKLYARDDPQLHRQFLEELFGVAP